MENKRKEFSKLTNETIKSQEDLKKKSSDSALFREEKRIQDDTNRLLKSEILKDDSNFVDAYENTPSSSKISKSRSLTLTNSTYSTKLLEKLVQGQTENDFTRATLAYQESSLKLLEEIKTTISELKPNESKDEMKENDSLEREVSGLAKSIAELDIPSLYKELKRSSIRMFDKTGIMDTMSMVFEMFTGALGDRSDMANMVKGKIKNGVLNKAFGKNIAQMINNFETDPMNLIQDVINMEANSSNQFFRTLFGKHAKGVEYKKPSSRRSDAEEFKALNDKLTYNTINFRLPESLDRIEAALTGNEKKSYDYETNKYLTDRERLKDFMGSGKHVDLRKLSEGILNSFKESLEDAFESGEISKDILKEFLVFDNNTNELKKDKVGNSILRDDAAVEELLLQIHKSNTDLSMLSSNNFSAENFLKNNNIKLGKGFTKQQQINAANTLNRIIKIKGFDFRRELDETLTENKDAVAKADAMNSIYSLFTPEQMVLTESFRDGEISFDTYQKLMKDNDIKNNSSVKTQKRTVSGGYSSTTKSDRVSPTKYKFKNGLLYQEDTVDREKIFKDLEKYNDGTDNASKVISKGSKKNIKDEEFMPKLELLLNNDIRDAKYYKKKFNVDMNSDSFIINDRMKESIDKDSILFEKATELYNKFLNAKLTPDYLQATTGQSYEFWKNNGYPTCPADLFKYITINQEGEAVVDYDALSKLNVKFNKKFIESIEKRYKVDTKGVDLDILDPGKTTSNVLNEMFKDPTVLKSFGVKGGGAAGFFIGKALQNKGIITSPLAPYLLGGVGAAIMNMESVQRRMNMVLGPEGDLKGKSGFSNREIAMAKFMNKTLPRIGMGSYVAKNFYKMFSGTGALGTGIGIIGGGTLGLITAAIAPSIMKMGRNALFGDDGEGNKGFIKSIGGMLKNIPWVEKYLSLNIKRENTNEELVSYALTDLVSEIDKEIFEIESMKNSNGDFPNNRVRARYEALIKIKNSITSNKDLILNKKGLYKRNEGEGNETYVERIKGLVMEQITKEIDKTSKSMSLKGEDASQVSKEMFKFKEYFKNNLDDKIIKRDTLADLGEGDISDLDYDTDVSKRNLHRQIESIFDDTERKDMREFFESVEDAEGKNIIDKMVSVLKEKIDEDGSKKEAVTEFKKILESTRTENADEALISLLSEEQIDLLRKGKIKEFEDSFYLTELNDKGESVFTKDKDGKRVLKENSDFFELMETLDSIGSLSEDYLTEKDIDMIHKYALMEARSQSNKPDTDPMVEARANETVKYIIKELNKKGLDTKLDEEARGVIAKIRTTIGKLTGDVGVMDGEDYDKEREVYSLFRKHNIMQSPIIREAIEKIKADKNKDIEDALKDAETEEEEDSGSGTQGSGTNDKSSIKMFSLKKYKFKNGKRLDLTGCSVATLNNMLNSLDLGYINIEGLITIANNHLNNDGSVRDTFYEDITKRMGLELKVYKKGEQAFNKKFFKSIKPSSKRGVIVLKDNPNLPYGHFIHIKNITGNNIVVDDPEKRGVDSYTFADLIAFSNAVYVFEKVNETVEIKEVKTIKRKIKERTGIDLNRSLIDNIKEFIKPKKSSEEKTDILNDISAINKSEDTSSYDTSNNMVSNKPDTIVSLLEKIYDCISNGILNTRVVDDVMMGLKVSDGSVSKIIGEGRKRVNPDDPVAMSNFYEKARINPVSKEEFKKADLVQEAIINGTLSGAGTAEVPKETPEYSKSVIAEMGGLGGMFGGLISGGVDSITKAGGLGAAWLALKNKFFKKAAKEGTEEVIEQGAKKGTKTFISKFLNKKVRDKGIQKMTDKVLEESGESGLKFLPKVAKSIRSFFIAIFERCPNILKRYIGRLIKTVSPFIDKFTAKFGKFMQSSKSLIEKKVAKNTAKGVGMKIPYLNIALVIGMFVYSFYDGFNNANDLIGSTEDLDIMTKAAIGFAKAVVVTLPGLVISAVNGWVGAAFEIFMELYGFKMLVEWFMNSNDESKSNTSRLNETKQNINDIEKDMLNDKNKDLTPDPTSENKEITNNIDNNTSPPKKDSDKGSGDLTMDDKNMLENKAEQEKSKEIRDTQKYERPGKIPLFGKLFQKDETASVDTPSNTNSPTTDTSNSPSINIPTGGVLHPLGKHRRISSVYGMRNGRLHRGIDFPGNLGEPVYAVNDGEVIYTNNEWGFVRIKHSDGSVTGYMHMDTHRVKVGDKVKKGEVIGTIGGRGKKKKGGVAMRKAFENHLHFEYQPKLRKGADPFTDGDKVDPFKYLDLNPNDIKLSPRSAAIENIQYLSKHSDLVSKLNESKRKEYDSNKAKGGAEVLEENTSLLTNVIGELNTSIKGLNISNSNSSSDVTALATTKLLEQIALSNSLMKNLITITANQTNLLKEMIQSINGIKVDPSDTRATNMSRIGTF